MAMTETEENPQDRPRTVRDFGIPHTPPPAQPMASPTPPPARPRMVQTGRRQTTAPRRQTATPQRTASRGQQSAAPKATPTPQVNNRPTSQNVPPAPVPRPTPAPTPQQPAQPGVLSQIYDWGRGAWNSAAGMWNNAFGTSQTATSPRAAAPKNNQPAKRKYETDYTGLIGSYFQNPEFANWTVYQKKAYEDARPYVYADSLGKPTIGIGHLITDASPPELRAMRDRWEAGGKKARPNDSISEKRMQDLFKNDLIKHTKIAKDTNPDWDKFNDFERSLAIDMTFNTGGFNPKRWPGFFKAWRAGDKKEMAKQLKNSLWYKQTNRRARNQINLLLTGKNTAEMLGDTTARYRVSDMPALIQRGIEKRAERVQPPVRPTPTPRGRR